MSLFSRQPLAAAIRASMLGGFAIIASPSYAGFTEVTENNPFDASLAKADFCEFFSKLRFAKSW